MGNGPFIDGLPINSMVIFHGYVSHNQMVTSIKVHQQLTSHKPWRQILAPSRHSGGRNRETPRPAAPWILRWWDAAFVFRQQQHDWLVLEGKTSDMSRTGWFALEQELQVFFGKLGSNTMDFLKINV